MKAKQILIFLLSLIMIFCASFSTVFANDAQETVDIYNIISEGIATSTNYLQTELTSLHEKDGVAYGYEWYIVSLLRAGKNINEEIISEYYESVAATAATWTLETKPSDIERTALALILMGKDITDINGVDLAALIYNNTKLTDSSNELSYALLALDASMAEIPDMAAYSREQIITQLLNFRTADGSFGLYDNLTGDVDVTAICLQALAPYQNDESVADAIEGALSFLKNTISENYNYSDNPNTTAQVLLALAILGEDVTDASEGFGDETSNIITALNAYRNAEENGYFYGDSVNSMATVQIMQAYDAYRKSHKESISYWNFTESGADYDDQISGEDSDPDNEKADSAVIYVTIVSEGTIVADKDGGYMAQAPVTVTDCDEDGKLTVDEALYAAHEAYFEGGAEAGYSSYRGTYGISLAILWGKGTVQTGLAAGYWLNDASCLSLMDEVSNGDYLTAFNYCDAEYWSDAYSYFTQKEVSVDSGNSVSLELKYLSGYDAENGYSPIFSACSGANVVFFSSNNSIQKNLKTDADGKVRISFSSSAKVGDYYVMAYKDDNTIVPAICKITVIPGGSSGSGGESSNDITVYIRVADPKGKTYLSKTSYSVEKGTTAYELLEKTGLDIETTRSAYGIYVNSVEGLAEFDEENESGWIFRVNGKIPDYSISSYKLSGGDYVELLYTRNLGKDVGDTSVRVSSGESVVKTYTVEFDTNGAGEVGSQEISKSGYVSEPAAPIKDGYIFAGWYSDANLEKSYDFDMEVTTDFTLYAKWIKSDVEEIEKKISFEDVKTDDWYYEAVKYAYENNLMQGTDKGFEPESKMTRAMLITVLWRMEKEPVTNYLMNFDDVKADEWYTKAIRWAASENIISGIGNNLFGTNDEITREQMATILYRYVQKKNIETETDRNTGIKDYEDIKEVSEYAVSAMEWAVDFGIIKGKTETTISPADSATRAEVAAMLMRFCEGISK